MKDKRWKEKIAKIRSITAKKRWDMRINMGGCCSDDNIDGDDNTVTYDGDGYAGGYFYLDHTGNDRTFNIDQESTSDNDWLKITSAGSNGTVCVTQSDSGNSFVC